MNTTTEPKTKREEDIERWFSVLKMRRHGLKWREIAAHYNCNPDSLPKMAKKAENIERQQQGLPQIKPPKIRTFVICENKRFYCLDKVYWNGVSKLECECGCKQFPIHSERGKELKALREKCKTALSLGDTRKQDKPALCSKFADWVVIDTRSARQITL